MARALSYAMLAGGWSQPELIAAGQRTLGARPRWLRSLAQAVLATYPQAPTDRPRELARFVLSCAAFERGAADARRRGRPLRVLSIAPAPTRMATRRWPVPVLDDLAETAAWLELSPGQLAWLADPNGRQRRTEPGPLHAYSYAWLARPARPPRLVEAPTPILKRVQRVLLADLLRRVEVSEAAHGFVPGRSPLTHARRHLGAELVVTLDLADFFARVSPARLYGVFRLCGYPEPVAHVLTGLCSTQTPVGVLQRMSPGGSEGARSALRGRLRSPHLPQGAPTSPAAANLVCFHLDQRLTGCADRRAAVYTRYADDLTFSGGAQLSRELPALLRAVSAVVADEGFALNPAKTRVQRRTQRQLVTGVVVNERPGIPRDYYDQLRAVLHQARTQGPAAANRSGRPNFRDYLSGRVEWVQSVNPGRGRRLRAELDAVVWPPD